MNQTEAAALETIAQEYQRPDPGRLVDRRYQGWCVDRLIDWVKGPEVLELGFGDAQWTERLMVQFGHSHVVDASASLVQMAREKYRERISAYVSLFEDFVPGKCFNTIIASYVLEHVESPVLVLRRAAGWLAPGGNIVISVPHAGSLHRRLAVAMGMQRYPGELGATDQRLGHRRVYTVADLERDVSDAGLIVRRTRGMHLKPLPQGMLADFEVPLLEGFMTLGDQLPMEYAASIAFDCVRTD